MVKDFKDCNVYEIYPNNFCDTNEDGYGDINGIIKKLDYIKDLGFNAIWVNSLYESKYLDGGYDVTDFYKISPRYGTMEDFENLLNEVHKRQMLFIMELIPGHASIYHPDFVRSSLPTKNEMSDLFIWTDDPWSWYDDCQLIRGCYDRSGAYVINFFAHQAAINYGYNKITHPSWQMSYKDKRVLQARYYLEDIMRFYLKKGVDGFRVDMADSLVKNDGTTKEATIWLWQQIRKDLKKDFPNFVMTSEWCEPNQALQAGFDSDFVLDHNDNFLHYLFRERTKDGQNIPLLHKFEQKLFNKFKKDIINRCDCATHYKGHLSLISGNHDTERLANFLTEEELRLAYLFLLTMVGVPYIYAGDEIMMYQDRSLSSVEGGYQRTGCRTPMRFDHSKNFGFSNSDNPYLPSNEQSSTILDMEKDENSLLNLIKRLLEIRNENESLRNDSFSFVERTYFAYDRNNFRVYINLKSEDVVVDLTKYEVVLNVNDCCIENDKLILKHHGGCLLKRKENQN